MSLQEDNNDSVDSHSTHNGLQSTPPHADSVVVKPTSTTPSSYGEGLEENDEESLATAVIGCDENEETVRHDSLAMDDDLSDNESVASSTETLVNGHGGRDNDLDFADDDDGDDETRLQAFAEAQYEGE